MRRPSYHYLIDCDKRVFELVNEASSYRYRRVTMARLSARIDRPETRVRSLSHHEAMVRIAVDSYLVSHACVDTNHCPHCGADVGNLCFRSDERGLITGTHVSRRDLWRKHNDGRKKNG